MRILRHSQISMTMDVYAQIPSAETRKALDRLSRQQCAGDDPGAGAPQPEASVAAYVEPGFVKSVKELHDDALEPVAP